MAGTAREIFRFLLATCSSPPSDWFPRLTADADVRCGAADAVGLLASLQATFGDDQLLRTGVVCRGEQIGLTLHPDLSGPEKIWIALRSPTGQVFDLVGDSGCLRQPGPAILGLFQDREFRRALENTATVFVTADMRDTVALRAWGFAAVIAAGLDQVAGRELEKFRRLVGHRSTFEDAVEIEQLPPIEQIVFVNFAIAAADQIRSAALAPAINHLRKLHRVLSVGLLDWHVWEPIAEECDHLRFAMEYGKASDIVRVIETTLRSARPLIETPQLAELPLSQALRSLQRLEAIDDTTRESTLRVLTKSTYEGFTLPLIEEAERSPDAGDANRKLAVALLSGEIHDAMLSRLVRRRSESSVERCKHADQELDDILQRTNAIEKLARMGNRPAPVRISLGSFPSYPRLRQS